MNTHDQQLESTPRGVVLDWCWMEGTGYVIACMRHKDCRENVAKGRACAIARNGARATSDYGCTKHEDCLGDVKLGDACKKT